jgi:hypothetical protein
MARLQHLQRRLQRLQQCPYLLSLLPPPQLRHHRLQQQRLRQSVVRQEARSRATACWVTWWRQGGWYT